MSLLFFAFFLAAAGILQVSPLGRRLAGAPALCLGAGIVIAFSLSLISPAGLNDEASAILASLGLGVLGFSSAAQLRVSRLARHCPSSFRLTFGGAPLYFLACSVSAFILLPHLSLTSSLLLGAALMLNGAAFDRKAVINAPASATIKAAVRYESAAIIALGLPLAFLCLAAATTPVPGEPLATPVMQGAWRIFVGFGIGGAAGLIAALLGTAYRRRMLQRASLDGSLAMLGGLCGFGGAALLGGEPVIAAMAAGLIWGEQTDAAATTRLRLRRFSELSVTPLAYFGFGCLAAPRLMNADLLSVVFALAAVTVLRAAPRLAILQTPRLDKQTQGFLAWFGGAPGTASALFTILMLGDPRLVDADGLLTIASLAIISGVILARATSRPLIKSYLRQCATARKQAMYRA